MPQEEKTPPRQIPAMPKGRLPFEPRDREAEVIDPKDPGARRAHELMRRGGAFSDRIRISEDRPTQRPAGRRVTRT